VQRPRCARLRQRGVAPACGSISRDRRNLHGSVSPGRPVLAGSRNSLVQVMRGRRSCSVRPPTFTALSQFTIRCKIHKMLQREMKTTTVQATSSLGESRMRHLASFHKIAIFGDLLSRANRVQVIPVVFCWTMTSSGMNRLFSAGLGRNGRLASWAVALTAFVSSGY
jgi:hypothetical protein